MIRRLAAATALAALLSTVGATVANAGPTDTTARYGGCVVIRPVDLAACINNPFESVPDVPPVAP